MKAMDDAGRQCSMLTEICVQVAENVGSPCAKLTDCCTQAKDNGGRQ